MWWSIRRRIQQVVRWGLFLGLLVTFTVILMVGLATTPARGKTVASAQTTGTETHLVAQVTGQPPQKGDTAEQIVEYIQRRLAANPAAAQQVSEAYIKFLNEHPSLTPSQAFLAFVLGPVGKALAKDIGIEVGSGGKLTYIAAQGTTQGLENFHNQLTTNPFGLFVNIFTNREVLVRVAEGVLGVTLIVVAVAKIISPEQTVINTVKKAIK